MTALGQITGEVRDVREWTAQIGTDTPSVASTKARTGAYSVSFNITSDDALVGHVFAEQTGIWVGAWLNHNGGYQSLSRFFLLRDGAAIAAEVRWNVGAGMIEMWIDGTKMAEATAAACGVSATNTWIHIGLVYINSGSCTFYVDGLPRLTYSGLLEYYIDEAYIGGAWYPTAYFDDFYIDGGITVDEAPPPDRFLFSLASAAGGADDWTPVGATANYECVDDAVPNNDTDYVIAAAADLVDLFATADVTLPTDYTVRSVLPLALVRAMAAGPTLKLASSDGANTTIGVEKTPGTSYMYLWESMETAPDGGEWTESKINSAQFGFKSAGSYS